MRTVIIGLFVAQATCGGDPTQLGSSTTASGSGGSIAIGASSSVGPGTTSGPSATSVSGASTSSGAGGAAEPTEARLVLPPKLYAVVGTQAHLIHRNLVLAEAPQTYSVDISSDIGANSTDRWTVTPSIGDVGEHTLTVTVSRSDDGSVVQSTTRALVVSPPYDGPTMPVVFVGDSITHFGKYPTYVATDLENHLTLLGTKTNPDGIRHEGYSGWTWHRFATASESPFLSDQTTIDIPAYVAAAGGKPKWVTWFLGTNDAFRATIDTLNTDIDAALQDADSLLNAWRAYDPTIRHAILLMPCGNDRQQAFDDDYDPPQSDRWAWRQKQHRWVERNIAHWQEQIDVSLVPIYPGVDGIADYPIDNALHPTEAGHHPIADEVAAWMAAEL